MGLLGKVFLEEAKHTLVGLFLAGFVVVWADFVGKSMLCIIAEELKILQFGGLQLSLQGFPLIRGSKSFGLG